MTNAYKKYLLEKEKTWTHETNGDLQKPDSYFLNIINWMKGFHIFYHDEETFLSMNKPCIVSVAFREPYVAHSKTQWKSILLTDDNLAADIGLRLMYFSDQLPHKDGVHTENIVEHFQMSLYGFKPHAIQRAIDAGYKKVIWFDPSVLPTVSVQVLIDALDEHPIIVRSGEEWLPKMCNAKAKNYFGVTDEEIKDEHSVAGTVYCFNFNDPKAVEVFEMWKSAEENGIFGTQDDFMAGHWCDEACLSLAMFKCNAVKYWETKFTYLNQKEL